MLGFKRFSNARRVLAGVDLVQKIVKGQFQVSSTGEVRHQRYEKRQGSLPKLLCAKELCQRETPPIWRRDPVPRSVPSSQPLSQRHRAFQHSWRLDETYCRVKGKWVYLYRAVDSTGATEIKSSEFGDNIIVVKKDIPLAIPHITMEQNFQCRG